MNRIARLLVLLFCFQTGVFSLPLLAEELNRKTTFWIYKYEGHIDARNSPSNETLSRWTVSAKINVYNSAEIVIVQLEDIKSSVFNGQRNDTKNVEEKEIPEGAKVLLQPFTFSARDDHVSVSFVPGEPLWAKNFKRGIINNMYFDINNVDKSGKNRVVTEQTLYGKCEVSYTYETTEGTKISKKIINHDKCTEKPEYIIFNVKGKAPGPDFQQRRTRTIKTATFSNHVNDFLGTFIPTEIVSESNIIVKSSPEGFNTQHLDQLQKFNVIEYYEVNTTIDISKVTEKTDLVYEVTRDPTSGRNKHEHDAAVLTKTYLDNYDKYINYFINSKVKKYDVNSRDELENMYMALLSMKSEDLKSIEDELINKKDYWQSLGVFYSILPYLGTDEFSKYLVQKIKTDQLRMYNIGTIKFLADFPNFIEHPNEKLLEELETLLNLKNEYSKSGNNVGVLSFASLINQTYKKDPKFPKDKLKKYIKLYHDTFLESKNYEERMVHLLGLINIADALDLELINGIITNTLESKHIRMLAITGFKFRLATEHSELFKVYWPIVQNKNEPFVVRVSALDILLSIKLTDEQFNTIITKYSHDLNDPEEQHLANYLITSLHSLQNNTVYYDPLGAKASAALQNIQIPSFAKYSATGNYRLAHTDPDLGSFLQTKLITDPFTNMVSAAQITYNSYGFSYNLGDYTFYFNINGFFDSIYAKFIFEKAVSHFESVPELLKFLKEYQFELKPIDTDVHIDIVLFRNDVAVYAVHSATLEKRVFESFVSDIEQLFGASLSIEFPMVDYAHLPSDLGTPLQFSLSIEDTDFLDNGEGFLIYRSTWNYQSWIESYNPLLDTNIASYKYNGVDTSVKYNYTYDETKFKVSWVNKKDSVQVYMDKIIGTSVEDKEILKQFCKGCIPYLDVPLNIHENYNKSYEKCGFIFNVTTASAKKEEFGYPHKVYESLDNYQGNTDAVPLLAPVLFESHYSIYKQIYSDDLTSVYFELVPYFDEDTETSVGVLVDGNIQKIFNPLIEKDFNVTFHVNHKSLGEENVSFLNWQVEYHYTFGREHTQEDGTKNMGYNQNFNFQYLHSNNSKSFRVCLNREILLPFIQNDRYSLESVAPSFGKLVLIKTDIADTACNGSKSVIEILAETFSSRDRAETLNIKQNKNDYEECISDTGDNKYVVPSKSCKRISARLAEYGNYDFVVNPNSDKNTRQYLMKFSRKDNDYVDFSFFHKLIGVQYNDENFINKTMYFPRTVINPIALSYGDEESAIPLISKTTCSITPSFIELFSGKYVPNQDKEWLAFTECYNKSTKGLVGHTVDKNHVGFTYHSRENVVSVTFKNSKLEVKLNGEDLKDDFDSGRYAEDLKVNFIGENVIFIVDEAFSIYYNTEYVEVKVNPLHTKLLCGICTKDQLF